MKTILVLLVLTMTSTLVLVQKNKKDDKVDSIKVGISMVYSPNSIKCKEDIQFNRNKKVVRLYKFKNSRVKKALSFTAKNQQTKKA